MPKGTSQEPFDSGLLMLLPTRLVRDARETPFGDEGLVDLLHRIVGGQLTSKHEEILFGFDKVGHIVRYRRRIILEVFVEPRENRLAEFWV